jgi:hypothetical protein
MSTSATTNNNDNRLETVYNSLKKDTTSELKLIALEVQEIIQEWKKQSHKAAIEAGGRLLEAKELFIKDKKSGKFWQKWIEEEFGKEISHDTATNLINLYTLVRDHGEQHGKGIVKLSLSALYFTSRASVEPHIKEEILKLAAELEEAPSRDEVASLIKVYRKVKLARAGVNPEVINVLASSSVVEDPKELKALSKLSQKRQAEIASMLESDSQAGYSSVKQAMAEIKEKKEREAYREDLTDLSLFIGGMELESYIGHASETFDLVAPESLEIAIIEAPMKFSFVQDRSEGFLKMCKQLEHCLKPGGFGFITIGHKAAMFAGSLIEEAGLVPLHLLVLRRQSGRSRSIVGINITSASVIMALVYKPPFYAPKKMIVDLQTITEGKEVVGDMDVIDNGLEDCLKRFLTPVIEANSSVLHCVYGSSEEHFGITEALKTISRDCGAAKFVKLGL